MFKKAPFLFGVALVAALAGALQPTPAQAQAVGFYLPTGRSNDPFVFCTEGVPWHGWIAVDPISGTWTAISYTVNYQWIPTYMAICPMGMRYGVWTGPGMGNMNPFPH